MSPTPTEDAGASASDIELPQESVLLKRSYKTSGMTMADLATATGLSLGTVSIALNGFRYRDGQPRVAAPPDRTLVRLSAVLGIAPQLLRDHGRDRAAEMLETSDAQPSATSEHEAQAVAAARQALARQVLAAFSTEELHAELARRELS